MGGAWVMGEEGGGGHRRKDGGKIGEWWWYGAGMGGGCGSCWGDVVLVVVVVVVVRGGVGGGVWVLDGPTSSTKPSSVRVVDEMSANGRVAVVNGCGVVLNWCARG